MAILTTPTLTMTHDEPQGALLTMAILTTPTLTMTHDEPQGALLKGVIDETGLLQGGEIFVQICHERAVHGSGVERDTAWIESSGLSFDEKGCAVVGAARVAVAKSPCMHPGDVRVLRAVDSAELRHRLGHHLNVIVFPQRGQPPCYRPHQVGSLPTPHPPPPRAAAHGPNGYLAPCLLWLPGSLLTMVTWLPAHYGYLAPCLLWLPGSLLTMVTWLPAYYGYLAPCSLWLPGSLLTMVTWLPAYYGYLAPCLL
jgi:hypothetical protein